MATQETTTTYRWSGDDHGLIDHIEIVRQKNGHTVAYIHANEDGSLRQKRLEVRAALRLKGWGTLSDFRNNQHVLRVNGMTHNDDLLTLLKDHGYTSGSPSVTSQAAEKEKPQGFLDSLRTNSLRASGIAYSLGNLVYFASGILRNRENNAPHYKQIKSAITWGAGDLLIATIGGKDDGRQLSSLLGKLKKHYEREGIDIPDSAAIHSETSDKNKTLGNKVYDFAHHYVNQIKCASEVLAAYYYYGAGKEQGNKWKQVTAVIFGTGFLSSLLIPEKKIDPEKYGQAGALEKLWMRIRANPLSVGGLSGYSNTILTSYSAFDEGRRYNNPERYPTLPNPRTRELKAPSKYYKLDYAAPAVMFFGNGLYAMSKKTTGGDIRTEAMADDVYSVASQILNKLPESKRAEAIESTIRFLAERPEVRGNAAEVREKLLATITRQRENPWFEPAAIGLPARTADAPSPQPATPTTLVNGKVTHVGKELGAANDPEFLQTVLATR